MSGTYDVVVGDRGRLVLPHALRERAGLHTGDGLTLVDTDHGIVMLTREQLKELVRADLSGAEIVTELLDERRAASSADDVA